VEERMLRDVIDDILVQMMILEGEIAEISKNEKYKGRIMRIFYTLENIHSLLIELRKKSREICGGDC